MKLFASSACHQAWRSSTRLLLRGGAFIAFPRRHSLQRTLQAYVLLLALLLISCDEEPKAVPQPTETEPGPLAKDSFVMRNPEIRKDLLEQLEIHDIEYWVNANGSIGFFVQDTPEVDRLANEAIGVYISLH